MIQQYNTSHTVSNYTNKGESKIKNKLPGTKYAGLWAISPTVVLSSNSPFKIKQIIILQTMRLEDAINR